jgi:hypothetical protein
VKVLDIDGGAFDGVEPLIYQMRFQLALWAAPLGCVTRGPSFFVYRERVA